MKNAISVCLRLFQLLIILSATVVFTIQKLEASTRVSPPPETCAVPEYNDHNPTVGDCENQYGEDYNACQTASNPQRCIDCALNRLQACMQTQPWLPARRAPKYSM